MCLTNHTFFLNVSHLSSLFLMAQMAYHISPQNCQNKVKILLQHRSKRTYCSTDLVFKLPIISTRNILANCLNSNVFISFSVSPINNAILCDYQQSGFLAGPTQIYKGEQSSSECLTVFSICCLVLQNVNQKSRCVIWECHQQH